MDILDDFIEARISSLRQSALCRAMDDEQLAPAQRLAFVPAMLFFAMGFRDIVASLHEDGARLPGDGEDGLWQSYLHDLSAINHGRRLQGAPVAEVCTRAWLPANRVTRVVVCHALYLARSHRSPYLRMILAEALEAAFSCFNCPVYRLARELGIDTRLHFAGALQRPRAAQDQAYAPACVPSDDELGTAVYLVNEVFDVFGRMFDCWHRAGAHGRALAAAA